ncbi:MULTISPECIES: helix-turn-helix domain-containing protein [Actinomadura]|nr:PucR family transcriptional regulator [Actinomadura madurae]MCP9952456.1 helix-turn-helix domain-containing protein [Actinomadura madurae]MCP9969211.1 helix-turn-helix domain-containing protein [Actinomadura madurae]MCP9981689.1 helix-turn-helix domain-containing protein [Actinomadura madurae]MCQ0006799.1 helix-turn-helix domain-containing protein [Actinomadura madurae]MCQ0017894.1 helix-turn-helix domain-containing protein [Actinomadura madurae]
MRPHLDEVADDMIQEIQTRVREYDRPGDGSYSGTLRLAVERVLHYFVDRVADPGHDPAPVTDFFRAIGRGEAGEGRSLDAMQTAMRVGGVVAWRRMTEGAEALKVSPRTLGAVGEVLMQFQDELAHAAAEGFSQAKAAVAGEMQRRRKRLLDLLFADPPAAQEAIADLAAAAHWPVPRTIAAVALGRHHQDTRQPAFPPDVLADLTRRTPSLIIPDPDGPGRAKLVDRALAGTLAVVGPTVPLMEAARSIQWARKTLCLVQRGVIEAESGVIRSVEHMSTLILFQDEGLITSLADLRLAPLAHLRASQQDRLAETLLAWLQSGRNANEVAMRLHVHPQTVRYRLRQLEELFGDQLLDPDLRFDLEIVLRARALLADNAGERIIPPAREAVGDSGEVVSLRRS